MAVFSGAFTAIGFAATVAGTAGATTAAVATAVASAVISVSAAIGVAGLAVTAIGMITKNQDLLKAGKIMGYVGLAGGLAGGAIGGFGAMSAGGGFMDGASAAYQGAAQHTSDAWDEGVGSWFSSDTSSGVLAPVPGEQEARGIGVVASTNPDAGAQLMAANPGMDQQAVGRGIHMGTPMPAGTETAPYSLAPTVVNQADASYAQQVASANAGPMGYTVPDVNAGIDNAITGAGAQMTPGSGVLQPGQTMMETPGMFASAAEKAAQSFKDMPDWMKMSMMTTGGQGVAGMASGYFAGASAEEKLEFDKYVNAQRQGQIDLQNRNANYVPKLRFNGPVGPAGIINTAGRR